jgi:DeoD family purine-nucleoside phosphorylase
MLALREVRHRRARQDLTMPIHLRAAPSDYAPVVMVPGDPQRAQHIAETFFDPGFRLVNTERGALGFTGTYRGEPISVQAVGMGGPSVAIYYDELIQLGARRLIRVGTAGGLSPKLSMGDTVIALSATADDQTATILTSGEPHAPTATWALVERAVLTARNAGQTVHVGPVVSSALFYDHRPGLHARWRARGHLCIEMEAAVLYTLGAIKGIETLCICAISDILTDEGDERIGDDELRAAVDEMMRVGCEVAVS